MMLAFLQSQCRPSGPSCVLDHVVSTEVSNNQPDTGKLSITPLHFVVAANIFGYAAPEQNRLDDRPELRPSNMLAEDVRNVVLQIDVHKVDHPARHRFTNTMVRKEVVTLLQGQLRSRTAGNDGLVVTKHDCRTLDVCTQIA